MASSNAPSTHPLRLRMSVLLLSAILAADCGTPIAAADQDLEELERLFYEKRNDPTFEGKVIFLSGVPLIGSDPGCLQQSQYVASFLIWARGAAYGCFHARVTEACSTVRAEPGSMLPTGRFRADACEKTVCRVFGREDVVTDALWDRADRSRPRSLNDALLVPTKSDVTTGLQILRKVDPYVRASPSFAGVRSVLATDSILWHMHERNATSVEQCEKYIDTGVPFLLHRSEGDALVCGYAQYQGTTYWMCYDLAKIERRVTLGYTSGSVTYSRYLQLMEDNQAQSTPLKIDPLFWDFESYFSSRNLSAFRLRPAATEETTSVIYPEGIDEERLSVIVQEEMTTARVRQLSADKDD